MEGSELLKPVKRSVIESYPTPGDHYQTSNQSVPCRTTAGVLKTNMPTFDIAPSSHSPSPGRESLSNKADIEAQT